MESLKQSVDIYQQMNWVLVPLRQGEKRPYKEDWAELSSCVSPGQDLETETKGIGLAHAYSRTCTIDLDDLVKARDWFLKKNVSIDSLLNDPKSVRILSGRDNKAKLLYRLPPDVDPLPHVKRDSDGFELRCGNRKGTTVQDVLPPSIHPDTGKPYTWAGAPLTEIPFLPMEIEQIWMEFLDKAKSHKAVQNYELLAPFIHSAIEVIDPDQDYNDWLAVGFALHSVGPDLLDLWEEWSSNGAKYKLGECESRWLGFTQGGGITLGTFFKLAYDQKWNPSLTILDMIGDWEGDNTELVEMAAELIYNMSVGPMLYEEIIQKIKRVCKVPVAAVRAALKDALGKLVGETENEDLTHAQIAQKFIGELKIKNPPEVVPNNDRLWFYQDQYWKSMDRDHIAGEVGDLYPQQKLCKTGSQYKQIAGYATATRQRPQFFLTAPEGVATKEGFFRMDSKGTITREINSPEHRQRWLIPVEPTPGPMPHFISILENAFAHDMKQVDLLQQVFGAIVFNQMSTSYQKAALFYGQGDTGKSVMIDIIRAMFPEDRTTTITPEKFMSEYNLAQLANSALNTYEELPDAKSISSPEFKALVAGGKMQGRKIYGDPIEYRAKCSHLFSSNFLPTTNEVNNAFFRRWVLFEFINPISPEKKDLHIKDKIIKQELSHIFHWAVEGMKGLAKNGWVETDTHQKLMEQWTRTSNIVLEFAHDTDWIVHGDDKQCSRAELFALYRDWCRYNDRKAITKGEFNHRVSDHLSVEKPVMLHGVPHWKGLGIISDHPVV